ncbi:6-bladed beta-propeller [uncultured Roseivirga sp.]|uniref:6-bladed beta-propeller n=1 Tax=uncultured Roseivirga sp. TaxID=543088 RepID=UPI0030D97D64|tara:strand:- start:753 stop:1661 length:909 start_codon:yes stop_codon:yes gene_type:complete
MIELTMNSSVDSFQDSIFFSRIEDIEFSDDEFYYLDGKTGLIGIFSYDLIFKRLMQTVGPGPEEVNAAGNFTLSNGSIYIFDNGSGSVKEYTTQDSRFNQAYKLPAIGISTDFSVFGNSLYISDFRSEKPLLSYSMDNGELKRFGLGRKWSNKSFDVERHILSDINDNLIVAYQSDSPTIELYSKTGQLMQSLDLSYLEIFKNSLVKYKEQVLPQRNTSMIIIRDVQLVGDNLYALITSHNVEGNVSFNKILKCSISDSEIKPILIYQLNLTGYYLSFSVGKNKLVAFNYSTQSIEQFSLNN